MARRLAHVLPLLACAATAGCGHFRAPELAQIRPIHVGGADATKSDGYYGDARAAIEDRDYGRALDLLQMARRGHEQDPRILNAFGVVYDKLGRFDLSARYYAQALALDPESAIVKGNLAYSQQLQGRWQTQTGASGVALAQQAPRPGPEIAAASPIPPPAAPSQPASPAPLPPQTQPAAAPKDLAPAPHPKLAAAPVPAAATTRPGVVQAAWPWELSPAAPVLTPAASSAGPGPRPYAVAFKDELATPSLPAPPAPAPAPSRKAAPALSPVPAVDAGPRPRAYAIAFQGYVEPAAQLVPASVVTPARARKVAAPGPRAGSLVLLDASGQTDRVHSLRTRLSQLGWSAGASVPQVAPQTSRTIIRYPQWRERVAQALARTLPVPTQLEACGRTCNFIQVVFGTDVRRWRLTPGGAKSNSGGH